MKITELYPLLSDQELKDLIEMVHIKTGIDPSILEKDFYLTGLLKKTIALSPDKDNIYFKGGTALRNVTISSTAFPKILTCSCLAETSSRRSPGKITLIKELRTF